MSRALAARDEKAGKAFRKQMILTLAEVAALINSSIYTARRRLKKWQALTSYNQNGRYYTLPDVPDFDANGLWQKRGVCFSQHGNLKQTVVELVHRAPAGLNANDMRSLLGVEPRSFLSSFATHPQLKREKANGRFVYYAADEALYNKQRQRRWALKETMRQPTSAEAIAILVKKIKQPSLSNEELSRQLEQQKVFVEAEIIQNFFRRHDLAEKKNATFGLIRCLSSYQSSLFKTMSASCLFAMPPTVEFRPEVTHCIVCGGDLKVQKTRMRSVSTLHAGRFQAKETFMACEPCGHTYRSEELCNLVSPGANFGYDVMAYAGQALWQRHRTELEVVAELAQKNVQISPREVSWLGMRFAAYLALVHQRCAPAIKTDMQIRGGYICHLDATCEGGAPFLMSSIDSLSEIVLGNVKLPAEDEAHIVPFLNRIKKKFGTPLALVHDMGKGILAAVAKVFPNVPDFICHFHFLRDIGKDFLGTPYDTIRKRLSKHGVSGALRRQAKRLKNAIDANPTMAHALQESVTNGILAPEAFEFAPVVGAYTLIQWALNGKNQGDGYGFPFDRIYLTFAQRLRRLDAEVERIKRIHLRGQWRDNVPYFDIRIALNPLINDRTLWKAVKTIEAKLPVFEKLRSAMRIALPAGSHGLNDEGRKASMITIETRVQKFRDWIVRSKDYAQNTDAQKMIKQIDKYWNKLFANPIIVQTPSGPTSIQPQRTNNILEQFFRSLKRANRRKTGNASSGRVLRTMLAETPLVKNLDNPAYMKILLNGKVSLEEVFAEIEIDTLRKEFSKAQDFHEKIPAELKMLIAMPDLPEKLATMSKNAAA